MLGVNVRHNARHNVRQRGKTLSVEGVSVQYARHQQHVRRDFFLDFNGK